VIDRGRKVKHPGLTIPLPPEPKPEDVETFTLLLRGKGLPAVKRLNFGSTTADIESLIVPGIGQTARRGMAVMFDLLHDWKSWTGAERATGAAFAVVTVLLMAWEFVRNPK
jgi:hypothetical protein